MILLYMLKLCIRCLLLSLKSVLMHHWLDSSDKVRLPSISTNRVDIMRNCAMATMVQSLKGFISVGPVKSFNYTIRKIRKSFS